MSRFRIRDEKMDIVFTSDTTEEIFNWLQKKDLGLRVYKIECAVDDIEVSADDFIRAFYSGERPLDLQFF